jgi:hypothetical protein
MKSTNHFGGMMATNPALVATTMTLIGEEPRNAILCRTLQAVAGVLDRLVPAHPLNREVELPPEWFKYHLF